MYTKKEILNQEESVNQESLEGTVKGKKQFVEPEISVPVDVLEATTFFQATSSGVTN